MERKIKKLIIALLGTIIILSNMDTINSQQCIKASDKVISSDIDVRIVEKVEATLDSVDGDVIDAYWKDSIDGNIYSVTKEDESVMVTLSGNVTDLQDMLPDRLLLWHDEFDGTTLDTSKWSIGNCWGDKESRDDDPLNSCYQLNNSILTLSAHPSNANDITQKWYSSAIISKEAIRQGYVQTKIKVLSNKYTNNAYWLNAPDPWPVSGEIDMLETSGDTKFEGALHYGNASGYNAAMGAGTYASTKDWFIAGAEVGTDTIKLFQNNQYLKDMSNVTSEVTDKWFAGINPFATNPKKCIFDIAVSRPKVHESGNWNAYIMVDYVRFYAPVNKNNTPQNMGNQIADFDVVIPGNRDVFFIDTDGKKKIQAHSKFMINIETAPQTELTGYSLLSDNEEIISPCSKYDAVGYFAKKPGVVNLLITHKASGKQKLVTYEVAQNMQGKVACATYKLGEVNAGDSKFWIADLSTGQTHKCVTNGNFKAQPNTTYRLSVSDGSFARAYNREFRYIELTEYDSQGNIICSTRFDSNDSSLNTHANTTSVRVSCGFTDGNNFAIRDYFDMLDALKYICISK